LDIAKDNTIVVKKVADQIYSHLAHQDHLALQVTLVTMVACALPILWFANLQFHQLKLEFAPMATPGVEVTSAHGFLAEVISQLAVQCSVKLVTPDLLQLAYNSSLLTVKVIQKIRAATPMEV
jgi:hypothetical protein